MIEYVEQVCWILKRECGIGIWERYKVNEVKLKKESVDSLSWLVEIGRAHV